MPISTEELDGRPGGALSRQSSRRPDTPQRLTRDLANMALPAGARHYTKLRIVSNGQGQCILFGWDSSNWRLTIWLPGATPAQWTIYEPEFGGSHYVEDFDILSNHIQGRKDDTLDLVVMAYGASLSGLCLYFPALPFSTKLEDWQAYFAKPIDLTAWRPTNAYQVRLGLLPKARRSVFICSTAHGNVAATRCDVDESGAVAAYPFDLGPDWNKDTEYHIFEPCVAARLPGSYKFDDGLVGSYALAENEAVVKVMLPQAPLGGAWELTPLSPLMGMPWRPVTGISTFLRPDTGEPIITYVMSLTDDSPLNKAVWVMDNDTLYHSDKGCWWLAAAPEQVFPPPSWAPVRALPIKMRADEAVTWYWLQMFGTGEPGGFEMSQSLSADFSQRDATNTLGAGAGKYFDATMSSGSAFPGETTAQMFVAIDKPDVISPPATRNLFLARLDNSDGLWTHQSIPVPAPPVGPQ